MLCSNICGLRNNFDELKYVIKKRLPDICFLNETHVVDECDVSDLKINNYVCIHCKSYSKHTGGVTVYVNSRIKYKNVSVIEQKIAWYLSLEIEINKVSTTLAGVYLSASENKNEVLLSFNEWFEAISYGKQLIVCGDFNIDLLSNTNHVQRLKNICCDNGMKQLVENPTRVEKNSATLIDLFITNINRRNVSCKVLIDDQITDHSIIEAIIEGKIEKVKPKIRETTVWNNYDRSSLWQSLENDIQQWDRVQIYSVDDKMDWLLNILSKSTEQFKKIKVIKTNQDFFDQNLEQMRKQKNDMYRLARFAGEAESDEKWHEYRLFKNEYKNAIKEKRFETSN